jgi:quercetin dioxygenase-like cupin family protein
MARLEWWLSLGLATASTLLGVFLLEREGTAQGPAQGPASATAPLSPAEQEARLARTGRSVPVESNINAALRRFEPGNKTYWHSHEGGFILFVQEGRARVQTRGGRMRELGPGEMDYAPPGVQHWHGAAPTEPLLQLGVVPFGGGIQFLEPVTDAQYAGTSD